MPNSQITSKIPAQTDWISLSKTLVIEAAFIGAAAAIVLGHATPEVVNLAVTSGAALGVLRITDVLANVVNVKSYLNAPNAGTSGVVPQATNTPLVTTNGREHTADAS